MESDFDDLTKHGLQSGDVSHDRVWTWSRGGGIPFGLVGSVTRKDWTRTMCLLCVFL